jgi:hypothetical protein
VSALTPLMMMKYQKNEQGTSNSLLHKNILERKENQTNTTNNMIKRQMTRKSKKRERDL